MISQQTINRIVRVTDLIEANAKLATPGPWDISHGHVIKHDRTADGKNYVGYDIASQPYERNQCVYGVHPKPGYPDMRHIKTCAPDVMLKLVEDVRELINERKP